MPPTLRPQINLLPREMREPGQIRVFRTLLRRTSFTVLILYLFGLLGLFAATLFFSQKESQLSQVNLTLRQEVDSFKPTEASLVVIRNRLKLAQSVFAKSSSTPQGLVEDVLSVFPASIEVREIRAEENKITISAFSPNSSDLSVLLEKLKDSKYSQIIVKNISAGSTGGYDVTFEVH